MNTNGYTVLKNFSTEAEVQSIKKFIITEEKWQGDLFKINKKFGEVLNKDSLKDVLQLCIGKNHLTTYCVHNLGSSTNDSYEVSDYHVDYPIHDYDEKDYPDHCISIEGILALDDFTAENGATYVVAGSHKSRSWPRNVEQSGYNIERTFLKKGDLLLFDSRLWHSAGINDTGHCRSALVFNFAKMDIEPKDHICVSRGCGFKKIENRVIFN